MPDVGKAHGCHGQHEHDEPSDSAGRIHAKKKTLRASEQRPQERAAWRTQAQTWDANRLLFIDECGSNIALTPRYGWAPKGERVSESIPRNRGKNTTLIASLSWQGVGECLIIEGATTASIFELYIEQVLAPALTAGQIVIMDNLSCHKGEKIRRLIEARGCQVVFLPAYSPDLSPIEEAFSKLKAFLRRAEARTHEALQEAISQALLTITSHDAQGWFGHCGYQPFAPEG